MLNLVDLRYAKVIFYEAVYVKWHRWQQESDKRTRMNIWYKKLQFFIFQNFISIQYDFLILQSTKNCALQFSCCWFVHTPFIDNNSCRNEISFNQMNVIYCSLWQYSHIKLSSLFRFLTIECKMCEIEKHSLTGVIFEHVHCSMNIPVSFKSGWVADDVTNCLSWLQKLANSRLISDIVGCSVAFESHGIYVVGACCVPVLIESS